jgi:DNA polymerase-3 subunit epsilon
VLFSDGKPVDTFVSLVDPDDYFDAMNVSIHGIDEDAVRGAPRFGDVYTKLRPLMANRVVLSHTPFHRSVLSQCELRHSLSRPTCQWLDTAMVVRRTWGKYARIGYGLGNVALDLGIEFRHHDAAEDARAAG